MALFAKRLDLLCPVSCVSLISTSTLEEDWQSRQAGLALDEFGQLGRTSGKAQMDEARACD